MKKEIPPKLWKSFYHGIRAAQNQFNHTMEAAFRTSERTPQLWQIYSGNGGLSAALRQLGVETRELNLPEWNFENWKERAAFLERNLGVGASMHQMVTPPRPERKDTGES